jgi:AcrR family transcriptional regulator
LIEAAADLFARKGFAAVSAESVAEAADRTTGALYGHFGGKEGLLLALVESWKEETAATLVQAFADMPDLGDRLAAIWHSLAGSPQEPADAWLLLEMELWLHGARDPAIGARLAERYADIRRQLGEGLVEWAEEAGVPLKYSVEETAALALGMIIGCAIQHRLDPPAVRDRTLLAGLADLLGMPDD